MEWGPPVLIELVYSNRTERLLMSLVRDLSKRREAGAHPLDPVEIVVPNHNMEAWVTLGLAQASGVAANVVNGFAGKNIVKAGDLMVESFNDGMNVDFGADLGGGTGQKIHEFGDIEPLHLPKNSDGTGGFAPVLFADGHVEKILDTVTAGASTARKGDGFLGNGVARNSAGAITGYRLDVPSYQELTDQVWLKRLRVLQSPAGSLNEDGDGI